MGELFNEPPPVPFARIRAALDEQPLFEDKTWRLSPEAFPLTAAQVEEIGQIGQACLEFYRALETLYLRSVEGRNLLRNRELKAPWVAEYLDRGKPEELLRHGRHKRLRGTLPLVMRPDLLLTEEGFVLSEMDSVPGGIGLTGFLNRLYGGLEGSGGGIVGAGDAMVETFYRNLAALAPHKGLPFIAILVSDEAGTYRPEMEWLAAELQKKGRRVFTFHPGDVMPLGNTLCVNMNGSPQQVDVIYRFWELFDLAHVPIANYILEAWDDAQVVISPPMRAFQEEKLNLALFHHHLLEDFWKENLSRRSWQTLKRVIPQSWVMDPVELPPNAVLDAPTVGGKPIRRWEQLGDASQKDRNLIIKLSGFHENAWGARSVTLGSDCSREEWQEAIAEAVREAPRSLYVLQVYHKPMRLTHPVFPPEGGDRTVPMEGRLRLCPYYFVEGEGVRLTGILATFCPADKKIIHGMRDAAMLPCRALAR